MLTDEEYARLPLQSPAPSGGIVEVFRRSYLLKLIVKRQLASQYSASFLGFAWSYLQPAVRFVVYYFAIGVVLQLHDDVPYFAIHLFAGMVAVHYFTSTFGVGTRSIWQNRQLVQKMAVPREVFPVAAVAVAAFHTVPQLVILTLASGLIGWDLDPVGLLAGLLGLTMLTAFGIGTALLFSAANVYFRDFQNIVATITQFMHFMVPMIYPYTKVSESSIGGTWLEELYLANPVAIATLLLQRCFWAGVALGEPNFDLATAFPDHLLTRGAIMLVVALAFLAFSQWVFSRLESKFPERL